MPLPGNANKIVVRGRWFNARTGQGVASTLTFDPVPLSGTTAPNVTDIAEFAWIKTQQETCTPNVDTGYYAVALLANDDPDLTAFGGWRVSPQGEPPFVVAVSVDAPTVTVDAAMKAAIPGLTLGEPVQAMWLTEAALVGVIPPDPPTTWLTASQTLSTIASGIGDHDEDPDAHPDIRELIEDAGGTVPDATTGTKGVTVLLGGTADVPTVPYGSITGTPASLPPSGGAGGVLGGSYPNPAFAVDMATQAELDAGLATKAASVHGHTSASISDFTEAAQDAVAALLAQGTNVTLTYDDTANTLTVAAAGDGTGLDAEAVRDAIGIALVGTGVVAVAVNDGADTITISSTATANDTNAALRDRATHTGTQSADSLTDGTTGKVYTAPEKTKLAGIATSATANASDASLRDRSTHTGSQTSASISDFAEAAQDAVAALLAQGTNVTLTYDDTANTLTVASSGTGLDAEAVRDAIGIAMVGVGPISVAVNDGADTITISTTATANDTNANLRDRGTHTGAQAISTVTGLQTALDGKTALTVDGVFVGAYDIDTDDVTPGDIGAQPVDSDLTAIAALTASNDDLLQRKSGAWTNRTLAQVRTDLALQPLDSDLTTIAGLTATTDNFLQAKSSAWASRTPAQVAADLQGTTSTSLAAGNDARFTTITANTQTSSYTLVLADAGKAVEMNNASANTLTIPPNSTVAFPVGTVIEVFQLGAGQCTVTPGAGVTLRAPDGAKTSKQYASVSLRKRATDEWVLAGSTSA